MTGSEGHLDSDEQSPLERGDLNVEFQYRLIEQLAETKRSSNEVLSFISDVVFRIDADQKILFLNKAWDTCLGIEVENSLGGRMTDHVFDEDRVGWNEIIILADDSASEASCAEPPVVSRP